MSLRLIMHELTRQNTLVRSDNYEIAAKSIEKIYVQTNSSWYIWIFYFEFVATAKVSDCTIMRLKIVTIAILNTTMRIVFMFFLYMIILLR